MHIAYPEIKNDPLLTRYGYDSMEPTRWQSIRASFKEGWRHHSIAALSSWLEIKAESHPCFKQQLALTRLTQPLGAVLRLSDAADVMMGYSGWDAFWEKNVTAPWKTLAGQPLSPMMTKEAWENSPYYRPALSFQHGVREAEARIVALRHDQTRMRQDVLRKTPDNWERQGELILSNFSTNFLDPLNYVPVLGQARSALWMGRAAKILRPLGRDVAEKFLGNVAIEAFALPAARAEQADYDIYDSLNSILLSTVLSQIGGMGLGKARQLMGRGALRTKNTAIRTATAQLGQGQYVHIGPLFHADPPLSAHVSLDGHLHHKPLQSGPGPALEIQQARPRYLWADPKASGMADQALKAAPTTPNPALLRQEIRSLFHTNMETAQARYRQGLTAINARHRQNLDALDARHKNAPDPAAYKQDMDALMTRYNRAVDAHVSAHTQDVNARAARYQQEMGQAMDTAAKPAKAPEKGLPQNTPQPLSLEKLLDLRNAELAYRARAEFLDNVDMAGKPAAALGALLIGDSMATARDKGAASENKAQAPGTQPLQRISVDGEKKTREAGLLGGLWHDLETQGLRELAHSGALDQDIARELWAMARKKPENSHTSNNARAIARVLHKWLGLASLQQNQAGAWVRFAPAHLVNQSHDMHKLRWAGFGPWAERVLPLLDLQRMGAEDGKIRDRLRTVYHGLVQGKHRRAGFNTDLEPGEISPTPGSGPGLQPGLIFRGPDAWMEYTRMFGPGGVLPVCLHALETMTRSTALMERLGPDPRQGFYQALDQVTADPEQAPPGPGEILALTSAFQDLEGAAHTPGKALNAVIQAGERARRDTEGLGRIFEAGLEDNPAWGRELARRSAQLFAACQTSLNTALEAAPPGQTRQLAGLIGTAMDGILGAFLARFSARDGAPGTMSRLFLAHSQWPGQPWWADAHLKGASLMLARFLGMHRTKAWQNLPQSLQKNLARHGIEAGEWDLIRFQAATAENGEICLFPENTHAVPDKILARRFPRQTGKALEHSIARYKKSLEKSLRAVFAHRLDAEILPAGPDHILGLNPDPLEGTALALATRFMKQFRSYPFRFPDNSKTANPHDRGAPDSSGLARIMTATALMGWLAQACRDLGRGKTPQNPLDNPQQTLAQAMLHGGGACLYADFLLGAMDQAGNGFVPLLTQDHPNPALSVRSLWRQARGKDPEGPQEFWRALHNTSDLNLQYTRAALDHQIGFEILDCLNPGFLPRTEKRLSQREKQLVPMLRVGMHAPPRIAK